MSRIGDMYYRGKGVSKDFAAAYANYKRAGDAGDKGGLLNVAILTERGEGVEMDVSTAASIYKWLAEEGYPSGQYHLARMTEAGLGGFAHDRDEAMRLYKLAARQGEWQAQEYLKKLGESW